MGGPSASDNYAGVYEGRLQPGSRPALQAFLAAWMEKLYALKMPAGLRWHLDVDPLEF